MPNALRLDDAALTSLAKLRADEQWHYREGIARDELALHIEGLIAQTRTHRRVAADSYTRPLLLALERDLRARRDSALAQVRGIAAQRRAVEREIKRASKARAA